MKVPATVVIDETFPQEPISDYGRNKLECERIFLRAHEQKQLNGTIIRPSCTYGPGGMLIDNLEFNPPSWDRIERAAVSGRTVTLKVKFADFEIITRSKSFGTTLGRCEFESAGQALLAALHPLPKGVRLLGLGLHNLIEVNAAQSRQLGLAI